MNSLALIGAVTCIFLISACEQVKGLYQINRTKNVTKTIIQSAEAQKVKENSEILHEIYQVVFEREPDTSEFESYLDILNQGASLEGLYNGFIHSSRYRQFEAEYKGSSDNALKIFVEELANIEIQLKHPTVFNSSSAQTLAMPINPEMPPHETVLEDARSNLGMEAQYNKLFSDSSYFTLKRILGDEVLKLFSERRGNRVELARWYSRSTVRLCKRNVNFGLALRNKPDEEFHYRWALTASEERMQWEILNRLHRLINESNKEGK